MTNVRHYLSRLTSLDRALELTALVLAGGLVVAGLGSFPFLPERIPVHFDWSGRADGYGSKVAVPGMVAGGVALYVFLTYLTAYGYHTGQGRDGWSTAGLRILRVVKLISLLVLVVAEVAAGTLALFPG